MTPQRPWQRVSAEHRFLARGWRGHCSMRRLRLPCTSSASKSSALERKAQSQHATANNPPWAGRAAKQGPDGRQRASHRAGLSPVQREPDHKAWTMQRRPGHLRMDSGMPLLTWKCKERRSRQGAFSVEASPGWRAATTWTTWPSWRWALRRSKQPSSSASWQAGNSPWTHRQSRRRPAGTSHGHTSGKGPRLRRKQESGRKTKLGQVKPFKSLRRGTPEAGEGACPGQLAAGTSPIKGPVKVLGSPLQWVDLLRLLTDGCGEPSCTAARVRVSPGWA